MLKITITQLMENHVIIDYTAPKEQSPLPSEHITSVLRLLRLPQRFVSVLSPLSTFRLSWR